VFVFVYNEMCEGSRYSGAVCGAEVERRWQVFGGGHHQLTFDDILIGESIDRDSGFRNGVPQRE
jgi:hypothetical protein